MPAGAIPAPRLKIPSKSEMSKKQLSLLVDIEKSRGKGRAWRAFRGFS